MKIVNGRFGSDRGIGSFTFNGSKDRNSTIDYCIASPDLGYHIKNFEIHPFDKDYSDYHSPIILTLNARHTTSVEAEIVSESDVEYNPV